MSEKAFSSMWLGELVAFSISLEAPIRAALADSPRGLTESEITAILKRGKLKDRCNGEYRVYPALYRMVEEGTIVRRGDLYRLPPSRGI